MRCFRHLRHITRCLPLLLLLATTGTGFATDSCLQDEAPEGAAPIPCVGDVERLQDLYIQPGESDTDARARIELMAQFGRIDATRALAFFYLCGIGGEQDEAKGLELLTYAAEEGFAWAQMDLGILMQMTGNDEESRTEALRWYEAAADNPESTEYLRSAACIAAGTLYEYAGNGQNLDKALVWYEKSGSPDGLFHRAALYAHNPSLDGAAAKAAALFEEAAQQGMRQAFAQLANLAIMRHGEHDAYIRGFAWFTLALETAWSDEKPVLEQELSALRERMSPADIRKGEEFAAAWKNAHPEAFIPQ
ncbi:sel1 repeat family protein [Desulfovibrio sp. OttesenSCG-928-I05]|nr:sel1 repeat family protein [Desulfovibrio sp. OttesenSCG-928-I05]